MTVMMKNVIFSVFFRGEGVKEYLPAILLPSWAGKLNSVACLVPLHPWPYSKLRRADGLRSAILHSCIFTNFYVIRF